MSDAPSSAPWKMIAFTEPHQRRVRDTVVGFEVVEIRALLDYLDVFQRRRLGVESLAGALQSLEFVEDLVARCDTQLDLVARRQFQLVYAADIGGVGDRYVQTLAGKLVRERHDSLESVNRNRGDSVGRDLHVAKGDQR